MTNNTELENDDEVIICEDYRGFLQDLKGMKGVVRGKYLFDNRELRYMVYVYDIDEYIEPTRDKLRLLSEVSGSQAA